MPTPFEILELPDDADEVTVKRRWHQLASLHHPDKGGSPTEFSRLHEAYRRALDEIHDRVCHGCRGTGKYKVVRGWRESYLQCPTCGGSGRPGSTKGSGQATSV